MAPKKRRPIKRQIWNKGLVIGKRDGLTAAQVKRIRRLLDDRGAGLSVLWIHLHPVRLRSHAAQDAGLTSSRVSGHLAVTAVRRWVIAFLFPNVGETVEDRPLQPEFGFGNRHRQA